MGEIIWFVYKFIVLMVCQNCLGEGVDYVVNVFCVVNYVVFGLAFLWYFLQVDGQYVFSIFFFRSSIFYVCMVEINMDLLMQEVDKGMINLLMKVESFFYFMVCIGEFCIFSEMIMG